MSISLLTQHSSISYTLFYLLKKQKYKKQQHNQYTPITIKINHQQPNCCCLLLNAKLYNSFLFLYSFLIYFIASFTFIPLMAISSWMTSLALVNGTAGGILLVLPIIGLDAGWLMIPIIIFIASLCCYYTATLMFMHLGKASTINACILNHFRSQKYCDIYNFTMFVSFFGEMILYFDLLVSETDGILYFTSQQVKYMIPFCVSGFLFVLAIVARYFHQEDYLLGYGILSMIGYAMFVVWIIWRNSPSVQKVGMWKGSFVDLGAAISQGYSIHNMMIPIILRSQTPQDYKKILTNVFVIGGLFYTLVAYGSFGLVNREVVIGESGDTVQDYFSPNEWQVLVLRIIFILNIVTVFPQFLSISKIRFFNIFQDEQQQQTQHHLLQLREILYYLLIVIICLISKIIHLRAPFIIELNGSVICYVEIYLIPIAIHLKCLCFPSQTTHSSPTPSLTLQIKHPQYQISHYYSTNSYKIQGFIMQDYFSSEQQNKEDFPVQQFSSQPCSYHKQLTFRKKYTQIILSVVVLSYGTFIMFYTFYTVFIKQQQ